jgi:hypothetical protein
MKSTDGEPMVVSGSTIIIEGRDFGVYVDQTPVEVHDLMQTVLKGDLLELTYHSASSYVDPRLIRAITPRWEIATARDE